MTTAQARARLVVRTAGLDDLSHEFGEEARLGRSADNDVVLRHPFLSSRHARIYFSGGAYYLEDLGSRNGTRVDGVAVTRPARLDRVNVITLADSVDVVFVRASESGDAKSPHGMDAIAESPRTAMPGVPAVESGAVTNAGSAAADAHATQEAATGRSGSANGRESPMTRFDISLEAMVDPRAAPPPAEPSPSLELVLVHADGSRQIFPLRPGDNVLGRAADCDVALPDPEMWLGRRHATLRVAPEGVLLLDLQSINGTFVDGQRVETSALAPGGSFRLGPFLELTLARR
jgi:pSer/pThr/pTyr-binding forkhead associated (FHA) protein